MKLRERASDQPFETELADRLAQLAATAPDPQRDLATGPDAKVVAEMELESSVERRDGRSGVLVAACILVLVGAAVTAIAIKLIENDGESPVSTERVGQDPNDGDDETATPTTSLTDELVAANAQIPIEPAGPYRHGQTVALSVSHSLNVDLANDRPKVCGRAEGESTEYCTRLEFGASRVENQGDHSDVYLNLNRHHFSPDGDRICGEGGYRCRFVWMSGLGDLVATVDVDFIGETPASPITVDVSPLEYTGEGSVAKATVTPSGITGMDPADYLHPDSLENLIAELESVAGDYDPTAVTAFPFIDGVCGWGEAVG